jgi:hypothetical protein
MLTKKIYSRVYSKYTQMIKEIFNEHNIICVDTTSNLNRSCYALFIIITIDANCYTPNLALGLVTSDKRTDIQ